MRALLPALLLALVLPAVAPSVAATCTHVVPGVALCDQDQNNAPDTLVVAQGAWTPVGGAGFVQQVSAGWRPGGLYAGMGGALATRAHEMPDVDVWTAGGCAVETAAPYGCAAAGLMFGATTMGRATEGGAGRDGSVNAGAWTYGDTTIDIVSAHVFITCESFSPTTNGCHRAASNAGAAAYGSARVYELSWGPRPDPVLCVSGPDVARTCTALPP